MASGAQAFARGRMRFAALRRGGAPDRGQGSRLRARMGFRC